MKQKLIFFSGKPGSGKDFIAKALEEKLIANNKTVHVTHFADRAKFLLSQIFKIDISYFYDRDKKTKPVSDKILNTPRVMMQNFGTDFAQYFYKNIWVDNLIEELKNIEAEYILVPDLRFLHELEEFEKLNKYDIVCFDIHGFNIEHSEHIAEMLSGEPEYTNREYVHSIENFIIENCKFNYLPIEKLIINIESKL